MTEPEKKKRRTRKPKASGLKIVISRTYSEGAKINIGNYQSRDFFASATRMVELPAESSMEERENTSSTLFMVVQSEVKAALKAETDDAAGTKPPVAEPASAEEAPSVPDAFDPSHVRVTPWKKFVPREVVEDDDLDDEL